MTFAQRVAAQTAIERVYHRHVIDNDKPFDEAMPRGRLERKVVAYLRQSAALDRYWNTPISAAALRAERERIARETRFPERLEEIFDALGRNSFVFEECFVRQVLAERLARSFLASDERIQGPARRTPKAGYEASRIPKISWNDWWEAAGDRWDWRTVTAVSAAPSTADPIAPDGKAPGGSASALSCDTESRWTHSLAELPDRRVGHTAVWTGTHMLVWGGWYGNEPFLNRGNRYDPLTDTWTVMSTVRAPQGRYQHTAVWTGAEMIVWGGLIQDGGSGENSGGRYDPQTDSWLPTTTQGAPSGRILHTSVWTGTEMLVWGGGVNTGGRYLPETDSWLPMTTTGAPESRSFHTAVWTDTSMVIWGGIGSTYLNTGGRYDPATDAWHPVSLVGAPSPRRFHTAVWTGSEMIIWGAGPGAAGAPGDGARYDPAHDTWTSVSTLDAPATRYSHSAVWTGERLIVWGGYSNSPLDTGGLYDPATDRWTSTTTINAPSARDSHTAVWTGDLMIVWGSRMNTGGRYDPRTDSWTPTSASANPSARSGHTAVWTGTSMIVWGGTDDLGYSNTGARYDPLTGIWTPTNAPSTLAWRYTHKAVWTGSDMIVWAGRPGGGAPTGDRYDPLTDAWSSMSSVNAPFPQSDFTAVWTGSEMIVWGGDAHSITGGRYNPASNTWTSTSAVNAPSARYGHSALWTGTEMIVWGGKSGDAFDTGGRYNPGTNTWTPTSTVNAPAPRVNHSAVWTGSQMIIWGGRDASNALLPDTGSRYSPVSDTWTPSAIVPAGVRSNHTAVWTGWSMVIWGGVGGPLNSGGIYDPVSDMSMPTSPASAPSGRYGHTAIWADRGMIVWGGYDGNNDLASGGILSVTQGTDADGDGFSVCNGDCDDAHDAVFPGAPQICDGLNDNCSDPSWPSIPLAELDEDGDGFTRCADDCDDSNAAIYPGAAQVCNDGINNNCLDPLWPDPGELDADMDGFLGCGGDCDDTRATVFPGASPLCDGLNNDCSDWRWPAVWVDERDADADGYSICAGDCDDQRASTAPGALEVNDGRDNQCAGEPGYGAIDEVSGSLDWANPDMLCWHPQEGATFYSVARSAGSNFTSGCSIEFTSAACWHETLTPAPGSAFHYLVRAQSPSAGAWGQDSAGAVRSSVCSGAVQTWMFGFTDTGEDDIPATGLRDFFSSISTSASGYIFVEVQGSSSAGALCSERADFHQSKYLAYGQTAGTASSGSWNKWYRNGAGSWSSPVTSGYVSYYGGYCWESWAWCPDYGIGGLLSYVRPAAPASCEISEGDFGTCGDGTWRLTIRVSEDRLSACGF